MYIIQFQNEMVHFEVVSFALFTVDCIQKLEVSTMIGKPKLYFPPFKFRPQRRKICKPMLSHFRKGPFCVSTIKCSLFAWKFHHLWGSTICGESLDPSNMNENV